MFSKEVIIGLTLWLTAAIGVGSVNGGITRQDAEIRVFSSISDASQTVRMVEANHVKQTPGPEVILQETYVFNERSERVGKLQSLLGIKVDQHYGEATRRHHLSALTDKGLETAFVPALPNPLIVDGGRKYSISQDPTHRCPQFEPLFAQYGLEPVEVFSYIAYRESRCNPNAVNGKFDSKGNITWTLNKDGSVDRGLIQINSCWKTVTKNVCGTGLEGLFDVHCNLKVAKYIMDNSAGGLSNWSVMGG